MPTRKAAQLKASVKTDGKDSARFDVTYSKYRFTDMIVICCRIGSKCVERPTKGRREREGLFSFSKAWLKKEKKR